MTPLIYVSVAWMLGIAFARWLEPPPMMLAILAAIPLGGLVLYYKQARPRFAAICGLAFLLGAGRLLLAQPTIDPGHVAYYNDGGDYVTLTAKITAEPDVRDTYTNLRAAAQTITLQDGQTLPVKGLVLVRAARYPQYRFGDTLEISAQLETPPIFDGFSYKDYLARQRVYAMMRRPRIKLLQEESGFSLRGSIYAVKEQAHLTINKILPEPQAALLNGILLGIESGIPRSLYDQFNATGASHVIVISGSNISLVVAILLLVGQIVIGKRNAAIMALTGVAMYTIMVGADAAVVRAAIMGSLFVIAMYLGRPNVVANAIFASALAMTLVNPYTLWDVGFQLSFLATLGLIVLVPPLEHGAAKLFGNRFERGGFGMAANILKEALLITIAAQIITTPLIVYQFGRLSLVSLLTNLLIVPPQPLVMIFGGLATMLGMVYLPLGQLVGWLAWLPLTWTVGIVQWTAGFPLAQVELPQTPLWLVGLAYLTIGAGVWWFNQTPEKKRLLSGGDQQTGARAYIILGGFGLLIFVWAATRALPDGKLHVAFLDVGQGDAILLTTSRGRQILIDGGPSPAQLGQRLGEEMSFWDHSLDMVVNTHPDADHLAGLVDVISRYEVDSVLVSDVAGRSSLYREWERQLSKNGQKTVQAWEGMRLQLDDGIEAIIYNPGPASQFEEAPNQHSVTMKIIMGNISFLLSGDVEAEVERALAADDIDLSVTVLKSPHHGSKTSSDPQFLDAANPQFVVISVGEDNRFGHPTEEILQRYADYGITVLRTDELGTVELITDGKQLWLETSR